MNGTLFFSADNGGTGRELWRSDGTSTGTVLVRDIRPGSQGSDPSSLTNVNGTLFFSANDGTTGRELWAHVPAPAQIVQVLVPANGHYVTGNVLTFQLFFNQPVFVIGTPHLLIIIGSTVRLVPYVSGHGTHQLVFSYVILPGDSDTDGIAFQPYPPAGAGRSVIFRPSGTSVRDADGIELTLAGVSFLMPNLSGITIN